MPQWFQRNLASLYTSFWRITRVANVASSKALWRSLVASTLCLLVLAGGLLGVASKAPQAHAAPSLTPTSHPFVAMGFAIGWQMPTNPPWGAITQEDLFALQTTNGTGLDTSFLNGVNVPAFVSAAHAHSVQALITIGGIDDQNWQHACTGSNRAGFVSNLVSYMQTNGFDGIDLDIEDNVWSAIGPPDSDMTACIEAISTAAKAVKTQAGNAPIISEDITTPWMGPWATPSQAYVDQYNLMTYGDTCTPTCASFASDVSATKSQGLPASKFVLGIDDIDNPPPAGDCGAIARYAQQNGLMGAFGWDEYTDGQKSYTCFNQFATSLGALGPTPTSSSSSSSPSPSLSPSPTPSPSPTLPLTGCPGTQAISYAMLVASPPSPWWPHPRRPIWVCRPR